jgi:hypothetical protein
MDRTPTEINGESFAENEAKRILSLPTTSRRKPRRSSTPSSRSRKA